MSDFADTIKEKAETYLQDDKELSGESVPALLVDFAIEKYKQHRNYPTSFTEEKIEADLNAHISTIAMAVVDLFAKYGAEGETSHEEKNITRDYENAYISCSVFSDVLPYVNILG